MTKSWTDGYEMDDAQKVLEQDMNQIIATFRGLFVLPTGLQCEVAETGGGANNYVQISTGNAWVLNALAVISGTQQVQISGVSVGGKARIDYILIDSGTNQVSSISGAEADSALVKPPDVPEDKCVLASVLVTDTEPPTVVNADITDRRFFFFYIENDLIGADEIEEENIIFDDSTGHDHSGSSNKGTNIPEAGVVFDTGIGHDHDGVDSKQVTVPEANVTFDNSAGHDHDGSDSKAVDHVNLANKGTNTHAQIDSHIADITGNPHEVDASDILDNLNDYYLIGVLPFTLDSSSSTSNEGWTGVAGSSRFIDLSRFETLTSGNYKVRPYVEGKVNNASALGSVQFRDGGGTPISTTIISGALTTSRLIECELDFEDITDWDQELMSAFMKISDGAYEITVYAWGLLIYGQLT